MAALPERLIAYATRFGLFRTGLRLGVAVSGGADSLCLLHLLREVAPHWNLHLSVVHVDHGIRGEAAREDARFVEQMTAGFGLPFHLHRADIPALGGNPEQEGRRARQAFFGELIGAGDVDRIATGHTASDQAETVLYRMLRGAGLTGLSGIRPRTDDGLVRPLLSFWRVEILAWLREAGLVWREDLSNQDLRLARNRLRHEIFPLLRQIFNPNLDRALVHLAILAQDEEIFWNETADSSSAGKGSAGGPLVLPVAALTNGPVALARRQIRRAIERVKGDLRQIDFEHIEAILDMARAAVDPVQGHCRVQLSGLDVIRSFEWIRIARMGADAAIARDFTFPVEVPGTCVLPAGTSVTFTLVEPEGSSESYDTVKAGLDWERLLSMSAPESTGGKSGLELRNWRPGDRYHPAGQSHEKKIKTLFQESRIPLWERRHWPVLTLEGKLVWSREFGAAEEVRATPGCGRILAIRESWAIL